MTKIVMTSFMRLDPKITKRKGKQARDNKILDHAKWETSQSMTEARKSPILMAMKVKVTKLYLPRSSAHTILDRTSQLQPIK